MPTLRLPLVGVHNQRSIDGQATIVAGKDQRFVNCIFDAVKNPITEKTTVYIEKRPGWVLQSLVEAGAPSTGLIRAASWNSTISAFGETNSTIYDETISVGAITGRALHFSETLLSSTSYILIRSSDGTGWYYASDANANLTYVGDTHTNTTIDSIVSTAGMYSGQLISGTNIVAGTRILSVDSSVAITVDTATTGTTADVTITKTPIAKILDADFVTTGTNLSSFVEMDGYLFYASEDGYIYHSDMNSIIAWTAANKIAANMAPDLLIAIARHKKQIIGFGANSSEFFYNAGNAAGSILSRMEQPFTRVGSQNQRSIATLEDDIYFVSSSRDGDAKVDRLRGGGTTIVSTPVVSRIIGTASPLGSDIYLSAFNLSGYSYSALNQLVSETEKYALNEDGGYALNEDGGKQISEFVPSTPTNLLRLMIYNIELNIWNEWTGTLATFIEGVGNSSINQLIASSRVDTSGKIYTINPSSNSEVYADDGAAYSVIVTTSGWDAGTDKYKFVHRIDLIADTEASGTVLCEASDDDYASWYTLGTFDLTVKNKTITGCGAHQGKRAYQLTHAANDHFRAQAIDITYELGTI